MKHKLIFIRKEDTEMVEDVKYEVHKSKILEASKKYLQGKEILKAMFPEAFEEKLYRCGTIFVEKEHLYENMDLCRLSYFYLLTHLKEDRTYGLINMRSGYSDTTTGCYKGRARVFVRDYKDSGIRIPDEVLEKLGLLIYSIPPEQKRNKQKTGHGFVSESEEDE
jgi:hypothetical protein